MPSPNDDLEARVSALESQMPLVRADAAAARVLAGGADRDGSAFGAKLDAHTRVLNALRETQIEQGLVIVALQQRFDGLEQRFDGLEHRFDGLEQQVESIDSEMRKGFAMMSAGMSRITTLLEDIAASPKD